VGSLQPDLTQAPWTLPAFASIFTGLYPEQHGAQFLVATLPPSRLTMAEALREAGYRTMGCVSHEYLSRASGMGQGFEILDETQLNDGRAVTSAAVTNRGLRLLANRKKGPFLLFLHYFDPHFCYRDHREFHYADSYRGRLRDAVENADQNAFRWMIFALGPAFRERSKVSDADRQFLRDAYDEEVAYTDSQIGRLLDYLDAEGLWDSTLVVVVADHGEELLERNWSGHTVTLYQELVHVPLIVASPGRSPEVDSRPVETRAIFDTVADIAGLPIPSRPLAAASLLESPGTAARPIRSSSRPIEEAPKPGEFIPKYVWLTSLIDGQWKLIEDHVRRRSQLVNMIEDPGELQDKSAEYPEVRRRLEGELDELEAEISRHSPESAVPQASEEQKRRLRSLGYL
jgi:arylsulfatase A-like enzyme